MVWGDPVPQPRPSISTQGGFGRAYVKAKHPIHGYRAAVAGAVRAINSLGGAGVRLEVYCNFSRPKSHVYASGATKPDAPQEPNADVDNLLKGIMDAITEGGAWEDDRAVRSARVTKRYLGVRMRAHTVIRLRGLLARPRVGG